MKPRILLPLFAVCALLLVACSQTETPANRETSTPAATTASPSQPATTASTAGENIGVPECDDFIAAYDACVSGKVPEMARAQYKTALEQWRAGWKKLADNPNTKATLAAACKQSAEQARASMKAYDCAF